MAGSRRALAPRGRCRRPRRAAAIVLGVVTVKSLVEAATGHLLFDLVHLGDLGRPNPLCHLGGVVGGVLTALVLPPLRALRPVARTGRDLAASLDWTQ